MRHSSANQTPLKFLNSSPIANTSPSQKPVARHDTCDPQTVPRYSPRTSPTPPPGQQSTTNLATRSKSKSPSSFPSLLGPRSKDHPVHNPRLLQEHDLRTYLSKLEPH